MKCFFTGRLGKCTWISIFSPALDCAQTWGAAYLHVAYTLEFTVQTNLNNKTDICGEETKVTNLQQEIQL